MSPTQAAAHPHTLDIDRTWKQAVRLHQKGRLDQAKKRYVKILDADPAHVGAMHLMGVLAHQAGQHEEAVRLITQTVEIDPDFATAHFNLGLVYEAIGDRNAAELSYQASLKADPHLVDALVNLGNLQFNKKEFEQACEAYTKALDLDPANSTALKNKSRALQELGNQEEGLKAARRAVELEPQNIDMLFEYGNVLRANRQFEEARTQYEEALRINPDRVPVLSNYGATLNDVGEQDKAVETLTRVLDLDPNCIEAMVNLANIRHSRQEYQEAIDLVDRALSINPNYAEAYCALGRTLGEQAMHDDALAAYHKAVDLSPEFAEALVNMGSVYQTLGAPDLALEAYEKALTLKPKMDMAYWNLALALLSVGRLTEGWDLFGYGFTSRQRQPYRPFPGLMWAGEDISDKTMMVWKEQGLGDDLRFSTVYHDLIKRVGHLIIETDARLVPLYQRTWPDATVRAETETSTGLGDMEVVDFDVTAPAGMAASFLRRSLDTFPEKVIPLQTDPELVAKSREWLASLPAGPKVGFAWRSRLMTKTRAVYHTDILDWGDLLTADDAVFINLQYDDTDAELAAVREKFGVTIHQMPGLDLMNDLDGAAALTASLDFVVSSPSSVIEMAGAVGTNAVGYVMSQHPMQLGTDCMPWFPNSRLYPMIRHSDQPAVIEAVTRDVRAYLKTLGA